MLARNASANGLRGPSNELDVRLSCFSKHLPEADFLTVTVAGLDSERKRPPTTVIWCCDDPRPHTRNDIDSHRLGYYGLSLGAFWGSVLTAIEPRLKASVLVGGGLPFEKLPSEIEPLNFAPRVKVPTLMLNGREDFMFPVQSSQIPLFHLLGVSGTDKHHLTFESGHVPPWQPVVKESLDWLDRYLGPVQ
jgi:hypothetical protein